MTLADGTFHPGLKRSLQDDISHHSPGMIWPDDTYHLVLEIAPQDDICHLGPEPRLVDDIFRLYRGMNLLDGIWKTMCVVLNTLTAVIRSKVPSARKPEAIYVTFGRRLRELREKNKLPQEELATFSGLTRSSIANIENGKQRVMLHHLIKFAEALRVDLDTLVPDKSQRSGMQEAKQDYLDQLRNLAKPNAKRESRR